MGWMTVEEAKADPRLAAIARRHLAACLDIPKMCVWVAARFSPEAARSLDPSADEAAWTVAGIGGGTLEREATTAPYEMETCAFINAVCLEMLGPKYRRLSALRVFMDKAYTETMAEMGMADKLVGAQALAKQCDLLVSMRDVEADAVKLESDLFGGSPHALTGALSAEGRARKARAEE